jgi:hydrogenase-4 component F
MSLSPPVLTVLAALMLVIPLVLGLGGLLIWFLRRDTRRIGQWLGWLTVVSSGLLLVFSLAMISAPAQHYPVSFPLNLLIVTVDFHIDALSLFFILLVNLIAFVASWNSIAYLGKELPDEQIRRPTFFHASVNLFHFTMLLVPMIDNLIGLWIAIELTTLVSAFLVAHRNTKDAWEAAWKYLIVTSTGIILALLGTLFLANAIPQTVLTGSSQDTIMDWTFLMKQAHAQSLGKDFVTLSFLFVVVGYGTKAGLAPMHTWLPDGHGEAPAPISALLSGVLLKSALYAILRFYTLTNVALGDITFTSTLLLVLGLLSLIVATPFILKSNRFKRVLAYHSLEHMGIIVFGVGIGGPIAMFGVLLHALNHAITKALMFLSFGNVMRQYEHAAATDGIEFDQTKITGVLRSMPWTGAILTLGGLALVGTPPFNIFMSELIILWGALSRLWEPASSHVPTFANWLVVGAVMIFMTSTTLIFGGLSGHLKQLVMHKMPQERRLEEQGVRDLFPLLALFALVCLLGVWVIPELASLITRGVDVILQYP